FVIWILQRRPVTNIGHPMLLENLHRMITEARVQIVQLARCGVISAEFVHWPVRRSSKTNCTHKKIKNEKEVFHNSNIRASPTPSATAPGIPSGHFAMADTPAPSAPFQACQADRDAIGPIFRR